VAAAYAGFYHGEVQRCPKGHAVRPKGGALGEGEASPSPSATGSGAAL